MYVKEKAVNREIAPYIYFSLVALFAGVEARKQWFGQGFRTLDDLRTRGEVNRIETIVNKN